jgi:hypothetical protein
MGKRVGCIFCKATSKCCLYLIIANIFAVAFVPSVFAGEVHKEGSHEFHRHHMALILGNTQNEDGESGLTVGMDYEYRINSWLGIGGLAEYAGGDFEHVLLLAPLYIHPYKGWLFNVSLGAEIHNEHGDHEEDKRTRDWIVRTGVAYQFPFGERYTVAPVFNVDFSDHETLFMYGAAVGVGF